jgi:NADH dehydrogenase subunit G (EC 1.6.5.3)
MTKLTIDGIEIEMPAGATVLQAAQQLDIEIPVFCYHKRLDIAGNCRMCLVEMKNSPKPLASCAMPIAEGMEIFTNTETVKKAREGVLEFLLMHHPLDCPICDQGGECDLQDITMAYGRGESRYKEPKRAVPEKYMGPLVKTFMTRCIHCTRCVRFADQITGENELGAVARGEKAEITTYLDSALKSELSGNVVDLCPVGALTSKPYAFRGRPWDLRRTNSIDVLDAVGSNISVHTYGLAVKRILPRLHEGINEEWISDKTRYACDGLGLQRLDQPYVRKQGHLQPVSWEEAFSTIKAKMQTTKPEKMAALVGAQADCEAIYALKTMMTGLGVKHLDCRTEGAKLTHTTRAHYLFNTTIAGIEAADACLIIGSNVRRDAAMVHARLRKRYLAGGFKVAYIGGSLDPERDFRFAYDNLGDDPNVVAQILDGSHPFAKQLAAAQNPMIIVGQDALTRADGEAWLAKAAQIAEAYQMIRADWNGFNVLHAAASRVGALDLGFVPAQGGKDCQEILQACETGDIEVLYLLDEDGIDFAKTQNAFVIYQGHHGDAGAAHADVILPGAAYTEKNATYVNTEGRVQQTYIALHPPGEAKEDWRIIRALSEDLLQEAQAVMGFTTLEELRSLLAKAHPAFQTLDHIQQEPWAPVLSTASLRQEKIGPSKFDFYLTDVISRNSATMARCQEELCSATASIKEATHA